MERLTVRDDEGRVALVCREDCKGGPACFECEQKAIDRLAAYEDTELEPEAAAQLKQIADIFNCDFNDPAQLKGLLDKLRDLSQAELDGRLVVLPMVKARWLKEILAERGRQDELWGSPQENTYSEWAGILGEEYGEVTKELNELNCGRGDRKKMETEAVQVAAVALSILEQADVAHRVTAQVAAALGRMTSQGAEAAVERLKGEGENG